jgi:hypothetical protein
MSRLPLLLTLLPALLQAAPLDDLRAATPPHFQPGHTLPPLTRWGWTLPYDMRLELCEKWGYALEFGGYVDAGSVKRLDDPISIEAKLVALTAKDPQRYPLAVLTLHGQFGDLPDSAWCHDADGKLPGGQKVMSPEAPDEIFTKAGREWAGYVAEVRRRCPIAVVLNGGEYGLGVYGFAGKAWAADPAVVKAKGERSWLAYISAAKARQEALISAAFRAAVPDRLLYLYYTTSGNPHRGRYGGWWEWGFEYPPFRKISDLASMEVYYKSFNSGWSGDLDLLTLTLNSIAQQMACGDALSYNWCCGGWRQSPKPDADVIGDNERYLGLLKCLYTAGQVGAVAGYFSVPTDKDPNWLPQMLALSQAHALFSHLENYLRRGDLLPGPGQDRFDATLPGYELPTGDQTARVLARKLRDRPQWLLTAWAAAGPAREVTVDVPDLGRVTLLARPAGSVYEAVAGAAPKLVDRDALAPTAGL